VVAAVTNKHAATQQACGTQQARSGSGSDTTSNSGGAPAASSWRMAPAIGWIGVLPRYQFVLYPFLLWIGVSKNPPRARCGVLFSMVTGCSHRRDALVRQAARDRPRIIGKAPEK